uniref:Uncharacterized protein n=1 Tax=Ochrobactrum phage ORM_20 TaxID=2985243 RepID=A0A9N6WS48_9VIRU|nr:hypothetical protein ORM20_00135 [Ochrobactrum phage ORM_20]
MSISFTPEEIARGCQSRSFPLITSVAPTAPCAAIAIQVITKEPEEKIIDLLDKYDPKWRRNGTRVCDAIRVIKDLGFKAEPIKMGKMSSKRVDRNSFSEVEFALRYRTGTYYVCTVNHAYVIHNQYVIDCVGKRNTRRLTHAYRIERNDECLLTETAG